MEPMVKPGSVSAPSRYRWLPPFLSFCGTVEGCRVQALWMSSRLEDKRGGVCILSCFPHCLLFLWGLDTISWNVTVDLYLAPQRPDRMTIFDFRVGWRSNTGQRESVWEAMPMPQPFSSFPDRATSPGLSPWLSNSEHNLICLAPYSSGVPGLAKWWLEVGNGLLGSNLRTERTNMSSVDFEIYCGVQYRWGRSRDCNLWVRRESTMSSP